MKTNMDEKEPNLFILTLLTLWILLVIITGLGKNYNLPQPERPPVSRLDLPLPQIRTEIIECELTDEVSFNK